MRADGSLVGRFQTLIGTVKTFSANISAQRPREMFQTLIGTVKTP